MEAKFEIELTGETIEKADKAYPRRWHAFLAGTLMQTAGGVLFIILTIAFTLVRGFFGMGEAGDFGSDMINCLLSQLCMVIIIPLSLILIFKNDARRTLRLENGINAFQVLLLVVICLAIFIPAQYINSLVVSIASLIFGAPKELSGVAQSNNAAQLLTEIAIMALIPGICEELFFRGYVLKALERKGRAYALIMSSFMFAVMHANFQQMVYAFLLGLVLGTVVLATDSVLASITVHSFLNFMSVLLSYAPINAVFKANQEAIFINSLKIAPVVLVLAIIWFVSYSKKRARRLETENVQPDMRLLPESTGQKVLAAILLAAFILINVFTAVNAW